MKKCKCEHWQTCPVCYPQGFDEAGNRKLVEIPPTRGEMLARIKELEAERDALAMQNQQMREALELAAKTISDLETSGDLDTETIPTLMEALALPDTSEIIKRHDSAVLTEVVERIIDSASIGGETGVEVVRTMIKEREKS